jgi:hypothetical protein
MCQNGCENINNKNEMLRNFQTTISTGNKSNVRRNRLNIQVRRVQTWILKLREPNRTSIVNPIAPPRRYSSLSPKLPSRIFQNASYAMSAVRDRWMQLSQQTSLSVYELTLD